jgi:hypothetical protein
MIVAASLVMMLATAAPSADAVGTGRKEFSKCLSAQVQPSMDKSLPVNFRPA